MANSNPEQLREYLGRLVILRFTDGEVVEVELLGVDLVEHRDVEYEVRRILTPSPARGYAVQVGGTYVGKIADLGSWESAESP
ncbi:MAG TPA: hypothetical protein VNL98_07215 [Gemmatimonadales bacterium]|nr:hypothetical protein [Gemmatimonadales bacterium]